MAGTERVLTPIMRFALASGESRDPALSLGSPSPVQALSLGSRAPPPQEGAGQERFLTGVVTSITSDGGMVNDYVYFEMDVVLGGVKAVVGDTVRLRAERKHSKGGWRASR